MTKIKKRF